MKTSETFIIAEAGVNHNGDVRRALEMVEVAHEAGADAVKFQTFVAEEVISRFAPKAEYQKQTTGSGEGQLDMVRKLQLSFEAQRELHARCREVGIQFLSTPFDLTSADFLIQELRLPLVKLPSGEITNAPLLYHVASSGVSVILSTGMATLGEIERALGVLACGYLKKAPSPAAFEEAYVSGQGHGMLREKVRLLHCNTAYPTPAEDAHLPVMARMERIFGLPTGYSDHTLGIAVPIAAVALGACVIEKHFTLDRNLPGPDHAASLEPSELKAMVAGIRQAELALRPGRKAPTPSELPNREIARKSLVARGGIRKGEKFTPQNVAIKRPANGLSPFAYWDLLGKTATRDYAPDEPLRAPGQAE